MTRRARLPSAEELFRTTTAEPEPPGAAPRPEQPAPRSPSGRVRHDEKMTVYVTSDELVRIEQARLRLRSEHGLAVDRGRLVRAALSLVLDDLEARGGDADLTHRLRDG